MSYFSGRITDDNVTWFDRNGQLRVAFGKGMTQFTSPSIQLGVDDPARVFAGNEQMNPMGRHVPSSIVSPQPTWLPYVPQLNIAMNMIFAIVAAVEEIEEDTLSSSASGYLGKPKRKRNFQIVDFQDFLPEDVTSG